MTKTTCERHMYLPAWQTGYPRIQYPDTHPGGTTCDRSPCVCCASAVSSCFGTCCLDKVYEAQHELLDGTVTLQISALALHTELAYLQILHHQQYRIVHECAASGSAGAAPAAAAPCSGLVWQQRRFSSCCSAGSPADEPAASPFHAWLQQQRVCFEPILQQQGWQWAQLLHADQAPSQLGHQVRGLRHSGYSVRP